MTSAKKVRDLLFFRALLLKYITILTKLFFASFSNRSFCGKFFFKEPLNMTSTDDLLSAHTCNEKCEKRDLKNREFCINSARFARTAL